MDKTEAVQLAQHYLNDSEMNAYLGIKMQVKAQSMLETRTHWIFDYFAISQYEEQAPPRYPKSAGVSVNKTTGKVEMVSAVGKRRGTNLALYRAAHAKSCLLWLYASILVGLEAIGLLMSLLFGGRKQA